jgi:hypothetical protein
MGDRAASRSNRRFHTPNRAIRDPRRNKHQTYDGNVILPWPDRGAAIWDPRDPFIVAFRAEHPRAEAAWRSSPGHAKARPKRNKKRVRRHFDFLDRSRPHTVIDIETRGEDDQKAFA